MNGEGASSSASKAIGKGTPKRKADGKDDRPPKKASITIGDKSFKKPSPPKPSHGAGKGLIMTSGPVTQGPDRCLLTHKDYVIKVVGSIIKDEDVDPCAEQGMEELKASGLFDLAWVRFYLRFYVCLVFIHFYV